MSNFRKDHPTELFDSIEKLLALLSMSLNVKQNLQPHQAPALAAAIYGKYYFYSLDEFALVLRMGKQGDLIDGENGKLFNKLDEETIMIWFRIYDERYRSAIVENARQQDEVSIEKENTSAVLGALGGYELVKKFTEELLSEDEKRKRDMDEFREKYFKSRNNASGPNP